VNQKKITTEKIVESILSARPEMSRESLLKKLEEKRQRYKELITDQVLLRMIGSELGIPVQKQTEIPILLIKDLIPGLYNISVTGIIAKMYPPRTFKGRKSGKVGNLFIMDRHGKDLLRVVVWNEKVNLIESGQLKEGDKVRFSRGYTRESLQGKVELHIGEKAEIEIISNNMKNDVQVQNK